MNRSESDWKAYLLEANTQGVLAIIEKGKRIHEYHESCDSKQGGTTFAANIQEWLDLGQPSSSQYESIGKSNLLIGSANKLPASKETLYLLSRLTEEQFYAGIGDESIHPGMTRKDVSNYKLLVRTDEWEENKDRIKNHIRGYAAAANLSLKQTTDIVNHIQKPIFCNSTSNGRLYEDAKARIAEQVAINQEDVDLKEWCRALRAAVKLELDPIKGYAEEDDLDGLKLFSTVAYVREHGRDKAEGLCKVVLAGIKIEYDDAMKREDAELGIHEDTHSTIDDVLARHPALKARVLRSMLQYLHPDKETGDQADFVLIKELDRNIMRPRSIGE